MWGSGFGVETVSFGNRHYYDDGMYRARRICGDKGCALIVNPPKHRTVHRFHIHSVHFARYGAKLKRELEGNVCGRSGWHRVGPCGGKAAYFNGFPPVFSKALGGGGLKGASVIAWPTSCAVRGTIVQLAYGCSLE